MPGIIESFLVTIMFLLSGIYKVIDFDPTVTGLMDKLQQVWNISLNTQVAKVAIVIAAIIQIVCPMIIMWTWTWTWTSSGHSDLSKKAKWACLTLAGFTVGATLIYHFPPYGRTYYPFMSNVTTFGALLLLANSFHK